MSPLPTESGWLALLEGLEDAALVVQGDGTIRHANAALLTLAGLALHQVVGRGLDGLVGGTDLAAALRQALAGDRPGTTDVTLTDTLGEPLPMALRLTLLAGPDPALVLFLRRRERLPQDHGQLLASIVDNSEDAIVTKTLDGTITSWNAAAARLFGHTAEQAIGQPITMLIPTESLTEEAEIIARIKRGEKLRHYEARRLARDGTLLDLSISVSPVRDAEGRIVGASKIARDMRQERVTRDRLTALASVYENCGEAIMLLNSKGEFVEVNRGFTEITGYAPEDMIGRSYNSFRSGRQSPQVARAMLRDLRRSRIAKGEIWTRRKDGSALAGLLTVTALPGASDSTRYIAILADVTSLRLQQERLERLAHYDGLTGLPNRLLMHERLERALVQAQAHGEEVCVAYLDIDGFKAVNDRFGHDAGDEILATLGKRMEECLQPSDTIARIGGDEFVLILPGDRRRSDTVDQILTRMRQPLRRFGSEIRVTASIGLATYPQDQGVGDQLIRLADQAMFEVKKEGGNAIRHFDSARQQREIQHRRLVSEVETALAEGQLELHLQPKVDLVSGAIVGAEGLLRWMHPVEGLRLPGQFLTRLLDHPVIEAIGAFVATEAMRLTGALRAAGLDLPLSINVTARELRRPNFAAFLEQQARLQGLGDPSRLQLELLETAALDSDPQILRTLQDCHDKGFRLAIDDFGVGFASLATLGRIPADTIKLDRSFVMDIERDEGGAKIAAAVVAMAAAFGKQVVAEGVETRAAARRLVALGCPLAQGFVIAPALPRQAFLAWARAWQNGQGEPILDGPLLHDPQQV